MRRRDLFSAATLRYSSRCIFDNHRRADLRPGSGSRISWQRLDDLRIETSSLPFRLSLDHPVHRIRYVLEGDVHGAILEHFLDDAGCVTEYPV